MSKKMLRRFRVFITVCFFIFLLLGARLAQLQIVNHEYYLTRAEINKTRILGLTAPRGEILDREGKVLATNKPGFTVSILDLDRREADRVIGEVALLLDMEEAEIRRLIWQQRYRRYIPVRLKTDVDQRVVAELAERRTELPGVILEVQPIRIYPEGNLASHILGRTGIVEPRQLSKWRDEGLDYHANDIVGRGGGIEEVWETFLRGQDGAVRVEVNYLSQTTRVEARVDPVPGDTLYLTLDARLQKDLEEAMRKTMGELNDQNPNIGIRGSAVALDPRTGAILASVSLPDYDLNTLWREYSRLLDDPNRPLNNRVIQGAYPVGSSYKVVPTIGGLEEGIMTPTTTIYSPGTIDVPGVRPGAPFSTKSNYDSRVGHGSINVVRALRVSSNTFFYQVGYRLGSERLREWGASFGVGDKTGLLDIMGERSGTLADTRGNANAVMDASIGQRHAITPLQMANMISMAANEGTHYRPYLVDRIVDAGGTLVYQAEPEVLNQLDVSRQSWNALKQGLEAVMSAGGTAARFRNFPYPVKVAGKTGTAEVGRGISPHSVSISYAPADDPEIALAVLIERTGTSSQAAVPITWDFFISYFSPRFDDDNHQAAHR